jgi:hypothetical protein
MSIQECCYYSREFFKLRAWVGFHLESLFMFAVVKSSLLFMEAKRLLSCSAGLDFQLN